VAKEDPSGKSQAKEESEITEYRDDWKDYDEDEETFEENDDGIMETDEEV